MMTEPPPLLPADFDRLRHALGAEEHVRRRSWGYRNRYACGSDDDVASWARLVAAGLAQRGQPFADGRHFYHATATGCAAAGLNQTQTRRALA